MASDTEWRRGALPIPMLGKLLLAVIFVAIVVVVILNLYGGSEDVVLGLKTGLMDKIGGG